MAKTMHHINLLPKRGDSLLIQFLNWALTVGRLIIILVETLALGTFVYRFALDWQIGDLKDKVKVQHSIVTSYKPQEDVFLNLQARLGEIKKYSIEAVDTPKVLNDVITMGKGYVTFRTIYVAGGLIRIEAQANSVVPLMAFVNLLKDYPQVDSISVDKVENKTSSGLVIAGLSLGLKDAGIAVSPTPADTQGDVFGGAE